MILTFLISLILKACLKTNPHIFLCKSSTSIFQTSFFGNPFTHINFSFLINTKLNKIYKLKILRNLMINVEQIKFKNK